MHLLLPDEPLPFLFVNAKPIAQGPFVEPRRKAPLTGSGSGALNVFDGCFDGVASEQVPADEVERCQHGGIVSVLLWKGGGGGFRAADRSS